VEITKHFSGEFCFQNGIIHQTTTYSPQQMALLNEKKKTQRLKEIMNTMLVSFKSILKLVGGGDFKCQLYTSYEL
jgi:hypothetical protein